MRPCPAGTKIACVMSFSSSLTFTRVLVLVLLSTENARGSKFSLFNKRDDSLATVNIPLTVNKDRQYIVGVNMSSTTSNPQSFNFALVSNTGYSAVASTSCSNCGNSASYNSSASTTERSLSGSTNITVGNGSLAGPFIKEDCSLHVANGSSWQYPNQTIINVNSSSSIFSGVTSGMIGLGTNVNGATGDFLDTVYGGWLSRNPSHDSFSFGLQLLPPVYTSDDDIGNGGIVHWVAPDSNAHEASIAWNNASSSTSSPIGGITTSSPNTGYDLPEVDWAIQMDGWNLSLENSGGPNTGSSTAVLEVFFPDILFPANQASNFYASIPDSVQRISLDGSIQEWTVPCDSSFILSFTFNGLNFPLDEKLLIQTESDGTCVGAIKALQGTNSDTYLLGSSFLSAFYIIFVVGRPGSDVPNSVGISMRTSTTKHTPVGAIVGGTIGGVAILFIFLAGGYFLGWRRRTKDVAMNDVKADEKKGNSQDVDSDPGAQYAYYATNHGHSIIHQLPTPPASGQSSYPLLSESHLLQASTSSPSHTPHTANSFSQAQARFMNDARAGGQVAMHVEYSQRAIGQSVPAPHGSQISQTERSDRNINISMGREAEPSSFYYSAVPARGQLDREQVLLGVSSQQNLREEPGRREMPLPSPQNIDPFSSSTTSSGGIITPLILPQSSRVSGPRPKPDTFVLTNNETIRSSTASISPAPPYSVQATGNLSSTLVNPW